MLKKFLASKRNVYSRALTGGRLSSTYCKPLDQDSHTHRRNSLQLQTFSHSLVDIRAVLPVSLPVLADKLPVLFARVDVVSLTKPPVSHAATTNSTLIHDLRIFLPISTIESVVS